MLTNKPTIAKATIGVKELAQHAGVSVGTVSRVLNGEISVSPKRREAVQKAIQSLGYKRTSAAQMLAARAPWQGRRRSKDRLDDPAIRFWIVSARLF